MVSCVGCQLKDRGDQDHGLIFQMNKKKKQIKGDEGSYVKDVPTPLIHPCAVCAPVDPC